jgi:hypothetical protein
MVSVIHCVPVLLSAVSVWKYHPTALIALQNNVVLFSMKLDFFISVRTGTALRSPVFHVILKSILFIHSIQLSVLPNDMEVCSVRGKTEVLSFICTFG